MEWSLHMVVCHSVYEDPKLIPQSIVPSVHTIAPYIRNHTENELVAVSKRPLKPFTCR